MVGTADLNLITLLTLNEGIQRDQPYAEQSRTGQKINREKTPYRVGISPRSIHLRPANLGSAYHLARLITMWIKSSTAVTNAGIRAKIRKYWRTSKMVINIRKKMMLSRQKRCLI